MMYIDNPIKSSFHGVSLLLQKWDKVSRVGEEPWPEERACASACCLNYSQQNPQLLVTGGVNKHKMPLGDAWVLDVDKRIWRKVRDGLYIETGYYTHRQPRESHN